MQFMTNRLLFVQLLQSQVMRSVSQLSYEGKPYKGYVIEPKFFLCEWSSDDVT